MNQFTQHILYYRLFTVFYCLNRGQGQGCWILEYLLIWSKSKVYLGNPDFFLSHLIFLHLASFSYFSRKKYKWGYTAQHGNCVTGKTGSYKIFSNVFRYHDHGCCYMVMITGKLWTPVTQCPIYFSTETERKPGVADEREKNQSFQIHFCFTRIGIVQNSAHCPGRVSCGNNLLWPKMCWVEWFINWNVFRD